MAIGSTPGPSPSVDGGSTAPVTDQDEAVLQAIGSAGRVSDNIFRSLQTDKVSASRKAAEELRLSKANVQNFLQDGFDNITAAYELHRDPVRARTEIRKLKKRAREAFAEHGDTISSEVARLQGDTSLFGRTAKLTPEEKAEAQLREEATIAGLPFEDYAVLSMERVARENELAKIQLERQLLGWEGDKFNSSVRGILFRRGERADQRAQESHDQSIESGRLSIQSATRTASRNALADSAAQTVRHTYQSEYLNLTVKLSAILNTVDNSPEGRSQAQQSIQGLVHEATVALSEDPSISMVDASLLTLYKSNIEDAGRLAQQKASGQILNEQYETSIAGLIKSTEWAMLRASSNSEDQDLLRSIVVAGMTGLAKDPAVIGAIAGQSLRAKDILANLSSSPIVDGASTAKDVRDVFDFWDVVQRTETDDNAKRDLYLDESRKKLLRQVGRMGSIVAEGVNEQKKLFAIVEEIANPSSHMASAIEGMNRVDRDRLNDMYSTQWPPLAKELKSSGIKGTWRNGAFVVEEGNKNYGRIITSFVRAQSVTSGISDEELWTRAYAPTLGLVEDAEPTE